MNGSGMDAEVLLTRSVSTAFSRPGLRRPMKVSAVLRVPRAGQHHPRPAQEQPGPDPYGGGL